MAKLEDDLLTIGAFAKRSRLSPRALRIYDELGLLPPVVVDPQTGYRYYQPEQVEKARLIGLMVTGALFVVYHGEVNKDSDGPVEVCVPFSGTVEPNGEAQVRKEPAHDEFFTRITKAQVEFPMILDAYEAVHRCIAETGRTPAGSPREVYFADWEAVGPSDPACDIAWPVESLKAG